MLLWPKRVIVRKYRRNKETWSIIYRKICQRASRLFWWVLSWYSCKTGERLLGADADAGAAGMVAWSRPGLLPRTWGLWHAVLTIHVCYESLLTLVKVASNRWVRSPQADSFNTELCTNIYKQIQGGMDSRRSSKWRSEKQYCQCREFQRAGSFMEKR